MAAAEVHEARQAPLGKAVVPLLALAVLINYVDRGNLATAAPLIKGEMHLSSTQIGILVSAFFWSYVPSHLVVGWLIERINAYRTLALGLAIWAIATAATGLVSGFTALLALRIALGVGESAAFPCASKLLAQHLPPHKLGAANGLISTGLALGPAVGTFFGGMLMAGIGWRPVFLLFGLASLLWLVPWLTMTGKASVAANLHIEGPAPSAWIILRRREAWGAALGQFCGNYAVYFVISWLPLYLVKYRGFSMTEMAQISGVIYLVYAASCAVSGRLCDRWIIAGANVTRVRKGAIVAGHVTIAASLLVCAVGNAQTSIVSLMVAGLAFGVNAPALYSIGQTLAGPRAGGKWIGLQNAFANIAGIVAPIITGVVVDKTGQFYWAFVIAGSVALLGSVSWGLMIGEVAPIAWEGQADMADVFA